MRLQEYEENIARYERLEVPGILDGYGQRVYENDRCEAADLLSSLSVEIRRCAWNPSFRAAARELAGRADSVSRRLSEENGLLYNGTRPRWPGFYSGGIYHRPID